MEWFIRRPIDSSFQCNPPIPRDPVPNCRGRSNSVYLSVTRGNYSAQVRGYDISFHTEPSSSHVNLHPFTSSTCSYNISILTRPTTYCMYDVDTVSVDTGRVSPRGITAEGARFCSFIRKLAKYSCNAKFGNEEFRSMSLSCQGNFYLDKAAAE